MTRPTPERSRKVPNDREAEEVVLGCLMVTAGADILAEVRAKLRAEDFYWPSHGAIFSAVCAVADRGEPPVAVIVANELANRQCAVDVSKLNEFVGNAPGGTAVAHARIVAEKAGLRRSIAAGQEVVEAGYSGDAESVARAVRIVSEVQRERVIGSNGALLQRWAMTDLLAQSTEFEWLISGLLANPTYGQVAGEMKTLKSYIIGFVEVGLAGGVPIFDTFIPVGPRPVVAYVGEGGRNLWTRRIRRICSAMGVDPGDLDLHTVFDVAPITSDTFQDSLRRDLDEIKPALVTMDPLYTYHGTETRASDLHQEGDLLNRLSTPCMEAGASLLVVNHMNQTGSGLSLKRITMAGSGEWVDTWLLLAHRENPDVPAGSFKLTLEIGSRQWGGSTWNLDLNIGRFNEETGSHDGEISWDLHRPDPSTTKGKLGDKAMQTQRTIREVLADCPWELTKTELKVRVGGGRAVFDSALADLIDKGVIAHNKVGRVESGVTKTRPLWGLVPTTADENSRSWVRDEE